MRSSGGSLAGLRTKAVTWCCLVRHAATAAEPTRPDEELVSRILVAEGGEVDLPAAPMMTIFMDMCVCESVEVIEMARTGTTNTLAMEPHAKRPACAKLGPQ